MLSGAGLALLLYALSRGADRGWGSPVIVATALGGVIVIATLVVVELRTPEPMLHLRLFGDRLFRSTNLACFFGFGAFLAMLFAASLFVQSGQGLSALDAGLATFPEAVGVLCGSQVAARLYPRVGPRRLMTGGLVAAGASCCWPCPASASTPACGPCEPWCSPAGVAMAFMFMPLQAATFAKITQADMGRASALYNTQRQTAGAVGVAVVATVLASLATGELSSSAAPFHAAFLAAGAMAAIGAVAAWTGVRDVDAAATMAPRPAPVASRPTGPCRSRAGNRHR